MEYKFLGAVLFTFVSAGGFAQHEVDFSCINKTQAVELKINETIYTGMLCGGLPEGEGVHVLPSGEIQRGNFVKGQLHGKVTTEIPGKGTVKAQFVNGKKHGRAVIHFTSGKVYEVFYRNGVLVEGVQSTDMYKSYSGEHNDIGQKHGYGKAVYLDGDTYVGNWKEGKPNGYGIYLWSDGNAFYQGQFLDGKWHGYGVIFKKGYSKYIGQWVKGKEDGQGIKYYIGSFSNETNGCFYGGKFNRGFPVGQLDCSRKNDHAFWETINNTKPDLTTHTFNAASENPEVVRELGYITEAPGTRKPLTGWLGNTPVSPSLLTTGPLHSNQSMNNT